MLKVLLDLPGGYTRYLHRQVTQFLTFDLILNKQAWKWVASAAHGGQRACGERKVIARHWEN